MKMLIACVTAVAALGATGSRQAPEREPRSQLVEISAERFSFTPSEIKATVGITLRIRLKSDDTVHGFHIIGSDVNIEIPKRGRGVTNVSFTPDKPGRYEFECSRLCGAGHGFMHGVIIVSDTAQ